ncbi:hypothetical protein ACDT10_04620 [Mycobacterium intracellulare]|uniref:hypothetical protein n=1 Tax=Mycobacterium TaxID=1763 RepID=UPI001042497E|nr:MULTISPECIES: hypothetical protein [Mycobacterium]MDM3906071.1 hypothetical protein [Mycobacterium intracellulare subsp. chimaera]MDM3933012.1 hypothetical protein [Mycobacterium intracellulare subsp. chimaera]QGK47604.1 hypothetical protein GJE02_07025 [Mycobacterium intracellulare subsp. chimaera]UCN05285.1 hypothetical protein LFT51_07090 [Mycobacterium intracellulare subsp. chimaera]UCN10756.1 hypothetical protein LFT50_06320 [Mycobacterium intracellulare subsp. chimaera]
MPFAPGICVVLPGALGVVAAEVPAAAELEVAADEAGVVVELPASPDLFAEHPAPTSATLAIATEIVAVRIAFARISIPLELCSPRYCRPKVMLFPFATREQGLRSTTADLQ